MKECRHVSVCLPVSYEMYVPASGTQGAPVRDIASHFNVFTLACALQGEIKVLIWTFYKSLANLPWVSLLIFLVFYVYGGCTAGISRCVTVSGCGTIALCPRGCVVGPAVILASAYTWNRLYFPASHTFSPTHGVCANSGGWHAAVCKDSPA